MSFLMGVVFFILGSLLVVICLAAIPGQGGEQGKAPPAHGHGGH